MSSKSPLDDSGLFDDVLKEADIAAKKVARAEVTAAAVVVEEKKSPAAVALADFKEVIVVVEDSATVMSVVRAILKRHHFGTLEFKDGQEALEALKRLEPSDLMKIKAIYSDLQMPGVDGLELLKSLRADERFARVPFVLVTSTSDKLVVEQASRLKVDGYLLKPVTADLVDASIGKLFRERTLFARPPALKAA